MVSGIKEIAIISDVLIPTRVGDKIVRRRQGGHKFVSAVILAAGSSKRLGVLKQLARLEGRPLLERTLDAVHRSKVDQVIVVIGDNASEVRRRIDLSPFVVVVNKSFNAGMSTSIKLGLSAVDRRAAAALMVMADQPFLSSSLIDGIVELFQKSGALIVAPTHRGIQGNPVLISRRLFSEVSGISGDVGAKPLLKRHSEDLLEYPVKEPEPLFDIDTIGDLAMARKILKKASGRRENGIQ